MIEIEFVEPQKLICECCNGTMTSLKRFVHKDGEAFAVYYLVFSENHLDNGIIGVIGLGEWETEGVPPSRVAFPFQMWQDENNNNITITNKDESPWKNTKILGRVLDREEALIHPWIKDVFHITDHIFKDDLEVVNFFKLDSSAVN